jgi:dihydrolipoamide dehydrogenase
MASTSLKQYDLVVIGGGPAGYAGAIRAAQLKKRVLCVEKENLGGTCLNWGCIPTKALLDAGAIVRRLRQHGGEWGLSFDNLRVDFAKIIGRSRAIADKLAKGIGHLFRKYEVAHEIGVAQLVAADRVRITGVNGTSEVCAGKVLIATGARARPLPGLDFDGQRVIGSREALVLQAPPARLAIIGAGPIGCEFADFYNAMGSQVTLIELQDHILPNEDPDCSILLERIFTRHGITVLTHTRTDHAQVTPQGVQLATTGPRGQQNIAADMVLVAIGVMGNVEGLCAPGVNLEIVKSHVKVDRQTYRTNLPNVWAVGDVIGPPWLAHVAHHEAIGCVDRMFGGSSHPIDYRYIPGCTYTHPQVASLGLTEPQARELKRPIRVGKFPFSASGRALAAGQSDGFVKLIFDAAHGELLGAHLIGDNVTELLSELVLARNLEATEDEIVAAMHPHPTMSEAVMEAAGVAEGRAVHL